MSFLPLRKSVSTTKRARERTRSLVLKGESFNLDGSCDFAPILKWMKDSYQELAPFPEEQDRFALFCLNSFAFPEDRVKFHDFSDINKAIADAKRGDTSKPVLRISEA